MTVLLFPADVNAQGVPDGRWTGAIQIQGTDLEMNLHFNAAEGSAKIDIPPQGAFGLALQNVALSGDSVSFDLPAGPGLAVFRSTSVTGDRITGTFTQAGINGTFFLAPNPETDQADQSHAPEKELSAEVRGGTLFGAIAAPETDGPMDLVIIHAGSGPTTRDGNSQGSPAKNNSLLLLSDALYARGIAVLRYDKRGIGASRGAAIPEPELRFTDFVEDLVAWIQKMRDEGTYRRIFLAGHSEGALIATLAANRIPVDGLILIAGAGRPAAVVLREQLSKNLPPALYGQADDIIAALENGEVVESTPQELASLFRQSVQPYLISWFATDPAKALSSFDGPTLVVQGTTDIQISVEDAEVLSAAKPDAELALIDGMNHVLKTVGDDQAAQLASYGDPSLPINEELVDVVVAFVGK